MSNLKKFAAMAIAAAMVAENGREELLYENAPGPMPYLSGSHHHSSRPKKLTPKQRQIKKKSNKQSKQSRRRNRK